MPGSADGLHQFHGLHPQRMCQRHDVAQTDVALAALDAPDVIAMQIGSLCQTFLRKTAFGPQLADVPAEADARVERSHLEPWCGVAHYEFYTL